ncbi:MAG: serine hydroxymethyltransferase [Candidatus Electryonea clarkiae]|nr:serine hydroxymethyltransferase [Candidatus Electryonea clarkiae]MDP8287244.1 serine hydroxymethyltransferase [Candidatus Electryonea clarkiae]
MTSEALKISDPEIADAVDKEYIRQTDKLEMIASENIVSPAVMEVVGSVMTNKYAEGYPKRRYYGGCNFVDIAENLAIERAKELFSAKWANVQPHSGSQANQSAYFSLIDPLSGKGKKIPVMGLHLNHGGHLTHGSPVNLSGRMYDIHAYTLDSKTGRIDMDQVAALAREVKPRMIIAGASAYPRFWDFERFREIADEAGAFLVSDIAHFAGMVAVGLHPDPLPYSHIVTTTTHKTLRGPRGGMIMSNFEGGEILLAGIPTPKTVTEAVDSMVFPGVQGGPLMHVIAAKAVAFKEALQPSYKTYMEKVLENAKVLAEELMKYDFKLVSDGTDNHLMLLDLSNKGVTGKLAEKALEWSGITTNKNMVPGDKQSPFVTSGIRIGTPALTTRGMGVDEMKRIAAWIDAVIKDPENKEFRRSIRTEVKEMASSFPHFAWS